MKIFKDYSSWFFEFALPSTTCYATCLWLGSGNLTNEEFRLLQPTWSPLARQNVTAVASLWRARARRQQFLAFSSRKA